MLQKVLEIEYKLDALLLSQLPGTVPSPDLTAAARQWSAAVWREAVKYGPLVLNSQQPRQGIELARHPVCICGVHRSGTTLLQNLLDGHPDLVVLPSEGTFYTVLESKLWALPANEQISFLASEWIRRLANPINQPPYWLLGHSTASHSPYVDFARYFIAWWNVLDHKKNRHAPHLAVVLAYATCTNKLNAKHWVDKTPTNERFLKRIWKEMPDAKIIHIIRDPLDTLNSRKMMEPSIPVWSALADMKVSFKVAAKQSQLNDPRYTLIRYEELCNEPQRILQRLGLFLNIPVTGSLTTPTVAGMPVKANSTFANTSPAGKILEPHQHRQLTVLSAAEHMQLAAYLNAVGQKLNYPVHPIRAPRKLGILLKHVLLRVLRYPRRQFQLYITR